MKLAVNENMYYINILSIDFSKMIQYIRAVF